ncbi:MAG: hypothetical protein R2865_02830 [Deinococcales bacterium]
MDKDNIPNIAKTRPFSFRTLTLITATCRPISGAQVASASNRTKVGEEISSWNQLFD